MGEQINFLRQYRADLVFPPWRGRLPWALPLSSASADPAGERR